MTGLDSAPERQQSRLSAVELGARRGPLGVRSKLRMVFRGRRRAMGLLGMGLLGLSGGATSTR